MRRWQVNCLGDMDHRLHSAALEDHAGKPGEAMIGRSRSLSRLRGRLVAIAGPSTAAFWPRRR